jgi:hypothetical protein
VPKVFKNNKATDLP